MTEPARSQVERRIVDSGVVAVLRGLESETVVEVARALHDGGVDAIEVTADTPGAIEMIEEVANALADSPVAVGAGTVLDASTATAAIRAGAAFVISPTLQPDVIAACNRYGVVVAPGVMTPTEALSAVEAGADFVKIFPAGSLGPGYVRSIRGPLPQLPIVPTGGVNLDNAADFVEAGAVAVGVGSALVDDAAIAEGDFDALTETARAFVETVEQAKGNNS